MQMEIESELTDKEPNTEHIIAEGFHEAGERRVEITYVYNFDTVKVEYTYFKDGEKFSEETQEHSINSTNHVDEGFWFGVSLDDFPEKHFYSMPENEVGEIYEDVLDQQD